MSTYPFPIAPQAYNWWEGNKFRMPPLGQYARPQYAEALAPLAASDPALAQAMPQAMPPGGPSGYTGDVGADHPFDRTAGSVPMDGMLANTNNAWDLFGGPTTALASIAGQALANGLAGNPDRPITGVGLGDLARSVGEAFGWGGSAPRDYSGYSSYETPDFGRYDGPNISTENDSSDAMYAKGGKVRGLLGPNPPGPDDGMAMLDRGEYVVRKSMAQKHAGLLDAINRGKVSKRKGRSLLD